MNRSLLMLASAGLLVVAGCRNAEDGRADAPPASYYDNSGHEDAWSGGARMVPISTPKGNFRVWVKRVGNNPHLKLLLLHGGPGATHEYFEAFDSFLPKEGV
jgi:proline iminopeptidase